MASTATAAATMAAGSTDLGASKPSPAAAAAAASSSSPKKRPAENPMPSMTKASAIKKLCALKPVKARGQSQYVRFKALLLKDAKSRGDTETVDDITKRAKEAWSKVKNLTPPPPVETGTNTNDGAAAAAAASNLGEDVQRYLRLKGRAVKEEGDEARKLAADAAAFSAAFVECASAYLRWHTIEATECDCGTLEAAIAEVQEKGKSIDWSDAAGVDSSPYLDSLAEARDQASHFRNAKRDRDLAAELRGATDDDLLAHAREHRRLLDKVEELNAIKAEKDAADAMRRASEEIELANATSIERDVTRALFKQMRYTDSSLKHRSKRVSYAKGGVSQRAFARAFDVAVGTRKATIAGSKVGTKPLRYGACLRCSDVNVKLVGEELVATASYTMSKDLF